MPHQWLHQSKYSLFISSSIKIMAEVKRKPEIAAAFPHPVKPREIKLPGEFLEKYASASCQIREVGREFSVTCLGKEFGLRLPTIEQAIQVRTILDSGIAIKTACEERAILSNSCRAKQSSTPFSWHTVEIVGSIWNTPIDTNVWFIKWLQHIVDRKIKEGRRNGITESDVLWKDILPVFTDFLNKIPQRHEEAMENQIATR